MWSFNIERPANFNDTVPSDLMKPKLEWKRISLPFVLPFDFSSGYSFLHVTLEQIVQGATARLVSDQKCFSSMQETAIFFVIFSFRNDHEQNEQLVARPRHGQSTARQSLAAWRVSEIESCRESKVSIIFLYIFPPQIMSNHSCMGPGKTENVSLRSNSWARACVF